MSKEEKKQLSLSPEAGWYRYLVIALSIATLIMALLITLIPILTYKGDNLSHIIAIYLSGGGVFAAIMLIFIVVFAIKLHAIASTELTDIQEATPHAPELKWYRAGVAFNVPMVVDGVKKDLYSPKAFQPYKWIYHHDFTEYNEKKCLVGYDSKRNRAIILKVVE